MRYRQGICRLLVFGAGLICFMPRPAQAVDPNPAEERAELFIGLLKRRAERILEAYRAQRPPRWSFSSGLSQGYESNVNLDGERRGDTFTEESFSLVFRPPAVSKVRTEFGYGLLNTHFRELTDSDLAQHNFSGVLQVQLQPVLRLDVGGEYAILNFPLSSDSSFFDRRAKVHVLWTPAPRISHKTGWTYQFREYDTRLARDTAGSRLAGWVREDQRHTGMYELQLRFPQAVWKAAGEFYRNFSNDQSDEFYDWDDVRLRTSFTRVFHPRWMGLFTAGWERKNYQGRSVPAIAMSQRDDLWTLMGSLIFDLNKRASLTYSLTYRYQDSNDPRLDFTDWINQLGVTVSF